MTKFAAFFRRVPGSLLASGLILTLVACGEGEPAGEEGPDLPPSAPAAGFEAPSFQEAQGEGMAPLIVHYVPSSGFAYEGPDGELTGVTVELLREFGRYVEESHGLDVTLDFVDEERWAVFYDRIRDSRGGVFGIGNVTITEERREELAFSPPYLNNVATLMTHEEVPELASLDEVPEAFGHLTGLLYPGTLHEDRMQALREEIHPGLETIPIESNDELVSMVASGEGYFGFIDIYNYWRAVEEGLPLRRHAVADDASEQFGVIMPRDSDWAPVMEEFFEAREGVSGTEWYDALLREHLGSELAGLLQG